MRAEAQRLVNTTPDSEKNTAAYASRLNNLAVCVQGDSEYGLADQLYKQSTALWEQVLSPSHPRIAQSLSNRASLYRLMHEYHEAERVYQLALVQWDRHGWPTESEMFQKELSDNAPLWAEQISPDGTTRLYQASIRDLRRRVESGSEAARKELNTVIERLGPWFHNLDFGGTNTVPADPGYPARRWLNFEPLLPKDLQGKSVLDIGCNAGYLSFEMKKRNAGRVVATDFMAHCLAQTRFGSYWFDLPVEPRLIDVYDIATLRTKFDYVLFVGVLYHLKHPLYALEKVAEVCGDTMIFQCLMRGPVGDFTPAENYPDDEKAGFLKDPLFPRLYFLEKKYNNDESNWWIANQSCLKAMLRVSGFENIQVAKRDDHFICKRKR